MYVWCFILNPSVLLVSYFTMKLHGSACMLLLLSHFLPKARAGSIHYARMLYRRSIELYLAVAWKVSQQHEHFWQYSNKCGTIERDRRRVFHPMQCYKRKAFFRRKRGFGAVSPSAPERRGYSALNLEARHQSDEVRREQLLGCCCCCYTFILSSLTHHFNFVVYAVVQICRAGCYSY